MIVDIHTPLNETVHNASPSYRQQRSDTHFATLMASACPLFSPWPMAEPAARSAALSGTSLSTHAASSNRREGRHARE